MVNIGLELGADISPYFTSNDNNATSSGLRITQDTNIVKYETRYNVKLTNLQFRILVPIDVFYKSFFIEFSPEVDLNYYKYTNKDTTTWYHINNSAITPYDTIIDNPTTKYFSAIDHINYSIGYQWKMIQLKISGKGFYMVGLSIRYLFIVP